MGVESVEGINDKIIIFACCMGLLVNRFISINILAALLIAISLSCFHSYCSNISIIKLTMVCYLILCIKLPEFLIFLPIVCYEIYALKSKPVYSLCFAALIFQAVNHDFTMVCLILPLLALSFFLSKKTYRFQTLDVRYKMLRDNDVELQELLKNQNRELIEQKDYEIHIVTLKERNRIAREIHDNVGHMLSRSILQVAALNAVNKNENIGENLSDLQITLSEAMDSIRKSVHNLFEDSINLYDDLQAIIANFPTYQIHLDYDMEGDISKNLKYCFLSTIKEALSNVVKHSDADRIHIILREHPAIYQLLIQDNGTIVKLDSGMGMGLENMKERVEAFQGIFNITRNPGFKIFISIPKTDRMK